MLSFPFSYKPPSHSAQLPLTMISLEDWALITLHGKDTVNYLQGQLTCDVVNLSKKKYNFAGICNSQGKILSNVYVFYFYEGIALLGRRSVHNLQLKELKKYAIFSKIDIISEDQTVLIGIAGYQAKIELNKLFEILPNKTRTIVCYQDVTILYFDLPIERFLLIIPKIMYNNILQKLIKQVEFNNSYQWLSLDIEAGYPLIDKATSKKFIPQAINLHILKGINFNKGCYIGQEMISRAEYRCMNKQALYCLKGKTNHIPLVNDNLEMKVAMCWRPTGTVMAACKLINDDVWIQAILNKEIAKNNKLRVQKDKDCILEICPLKYTV